MGLQQRIELILDEAAAKVYEEAMRDAGEKGGKALEQGTKEAAGGIKEFFKEMAKGAAAFFTVRAVVEFGKASVEAFKGAESAANLYSAAAERVGATNEQIAEDLDRFKQMASRTPFNEEEISRAGRQLVLITQDENKAMAALPLVMDLARARSVDLTTASVALGAALQGHPEALRRLRIELDPTRDLFEQLREQVGGFATDGTALEKVTWAMSGAMAELRESIGKAIVEAGGGTTVVDVLTSAIRELSKFVRENEGLWWALGQVIGGVVLAVKELFRAVGVLIDLFEIALAPIVAGVAGTFALMAKGVSAALSGLAEMAGFLGKPEWKQTLKDTAKDIGEIADKLMQVSKNAQAIPREKVREWLSGTPPTESKPLADRAASGLVPGGVQSEGMMYVPGAGWIPAKKYNEMLERGAAREKEADEAAKRRLKEWRAEVQRALDDQGKQLQHAREVAQKAFDTAVGLQLQGEAARSKELQAGLDKLKATYSELEKQAKNDEVVYLHRMDAIKAAQQEAADAADQDAARIGAAQAAAADAANQWKEDLIKVGEQVAAIAKGMLGLLDAVGAVSDETRRALQGFINIGEGIKGILTPGGLVGGITQVVGGLAGLVKGLFGESKERKEWLEAVRANTDATKDNTEMVAKVSGTVTGRQLSDVQKFLTTGLGAPGTPSWKGLSTPQMMEALKQQTGMSWADLQKFAANFNITLPSEETMRKQGNYIPLLLPLLEQIRKYLAGTGATFEERQKQQQMQWQAWRSTPGQQFEQQLGLYRQFSPGFGNITFGQYGGLTGYAALEKQLAQRLEAAAKGPVAPELLGKLTQEQYVEGLKDLLDRVRDLIEDRKREAADAKAAREEARRKELEGLTEEQRAAVEKRHAEEEKAALYATLRDATAIGGTAQIAAQAALDLYNQYLTAAKGPLGPEGPLARDLYDRFQDAFRDAQQAVEQKGGGVSLTGPNLTPGYSVQQQFTVEQGNVVAGELREANVHLSRIEQYMATVVGAGAGLRPPLYVTVNVPQGTDPAGVSVTVDQQLGSRYQAAALANGSPVLQ